MIRFILNDEEVSTELPPGTVLLDLIRYHRHLMGTKIGCREGDCGACTILIGELQGNHVKYQSMTSCLVPLGNAHGKHIVTIEGINQPGRLNPIQQAMADAGATQCGFCTPGFVMSLAGFCVGEKEPSTENAIAAIDGNICRCTGYKSIEKAASKVASLLAANKNRENPDKNIFPEYFTGIKNKLAALNSNGLGVHEQQIAVGGGTDLYVQKHDEMTHASISFVFDRPELNGISKEDNTCVAGPSTTVSDLKNSAIINDAFPSFQRYAKLVSSTPIRNMATIAGNFINASPIGDFTIFFLALNAQLVLRDGNSKRSLPLRKLYKGYKTLDKKPGELIEKISFELPRKNQRFHFEKVSKRTHLDIASVNSAILLTIDNDIITDVAISAGGVGPIPLYLEKTSRAMKGKPVSEELVYEAIEIMQTEISPISDARGTADYKRLLLAQLIKAHFITLFPALEIDKLLEVH